MGNCCAWPQEDDGDGSSDYGQSTDDTDEDQPESESSYFERWCLEDFHVYDRITIGDPPWAELPLPPTWPPCTAGQFRKTWQHALSVTT